MSWLPLWVPAAKADFDGEEFTAHKRRRPEDRLSAGLNDSAFFVNETQDESHDIRRDSFCISVALSKRKNRFIFSFLAF
jgi:hypothetical protein